MVPQISLPYLLHSIETLPLKSFIDCYTGNSLTGLIINGAPTDLQLQQHFLNITIEYYDLVGHEQTKTYVMLQKQAVKLNAKINQLIAIMKVYLLTKDTELKKLMGKYGFYFETLQPENITLIQFDGYVTSLKIELDNRGKDVERLNKGNAGNVTRETFFNNIIEMRKENYLVDLEKTTVEEYALIVKSFNNLIEAKIKSAA